MTEPHYGQPFLSTPRALSAAAREFVRLGDSLADGVASGFTDAVDVQSTVRRSPERCIIQVGDAAVTVAWICSRRDPADGELLIIHWRGIVAPSIKQQFERARELTLTATPVCETVYLADATCEADWMWRSREEPEQRYTSPSLAAHVIERLRNIHDSIDRRASA